uniref:Zinc knuckle CX2CX4HX4C domain-containing protein n=1 Tax=Chenopodium quinoa TaxID=63459 RepID=A0A803MV72_CHEQI
MVEELVKDWEKLRLTDEEGVVLGGDYIEHVSEDMKAKINLTLVGKLWTVKPYNLEAMKRTLMNVWRLKEKFAIMVVETNLFVFQFFCEDDKDQTPMWVRLIDVPLNKRSVAVMYDVGEFLGGFIEADETDPLGWNDCLRIKVLVDINKPLRRGLFLAMGQNKPRWVDIKYETLADFCFFYGRLEHTEKECQFKEQAKEEDEKMVFQYGLWLRASPKKKPKIDNADRETEKIWMERLKKSGVSKKTPTYNDPNVIKLGSVGAARKLAFNSPKNDDIKERKAPLRNREAELCAVWDNKGEKLVFRSMGAVMNAEKEFKYERVEIEGVADSNQEVLVMNVKEGDGKDVKKGGEREEREHGRKMNVKDETKGVDVEMGDKGRGLKKLASVGEGRKRSGGLALLWKDTVEVEIKSYSLHHIDSWVKIPSMQGWRFTGVYGHPKAEKKKLTCEMLENLRGNPIIPWLCGGDFNMMLMASEKQGGSEFLMGEAEGFRMAVEVCELADLGNVGHGFTWTNN